MLARSQEITKFLSYADSEAPNTALDIGAGTGQLTRELFHRGYKCVGVEASASAVKLAKSLTVMPQDSMSYHHFDIEKDNLKDLSHAPYGLITCKLVYAFIKDREAFLDRVSSILAPNGLFVVITPLPEDVPIEKQNIAVPPEAMNILAESFDQVALYREFGLTYFIGKPKTKTQ